VPPGATETAINASADRFREILIELKQPGPICPPFAAANLPGPITRK
jgi:hypothetical protein